MHVFVYVCLSLTYLSLVFSCAGQSRETRVIRLLARNTVEEGVVQEQVRKMGLRTGGEATMTDVDPGTLLAIVKDHLDLSEQAIAGFSGPAEASMEAGS